MKKMKLNTLMGCLLVIALMTAGLAVQASQPQPTAMTQESDGTYVVNTSTLCKVKGYRSTTPLKIYIKGGKVQKVEALKNQETPKYFALVKNQILSSWNGLTVKKAVKLNVDGVTGATLSSDAVKKNMKAGLEYYQKNSK